MSLIGFSLIGEWEFPAIVGSLSNETVRLNYPTFNADVLDKLDDGGGDLRFSSDIAGLNQLPCEVVEFDKVGASIEVWVNVPVSATGQVVYVWGNNTGATQPAVTDPFGRNAANPNRTFRTHCGNITPVDSSGNLTSGIVSNNITVVSGMLGSALDFNGSSSDVNLGAMIQPSGDFTQRIWINADSLPNFAGVVGNWVSGAANRSYLGTQDSQANFNTYNSAGSIQGGTITTGNYHLITASRIGTTVTLYVDGVAVNTVENSDNPNPANNTYLGALANGTSFFFNGQLAEVDIIDVGSDANSELLAYQNQSATGAWGTMTAIDSGNTSIIAFEVPSPLFSVVAEFTPSGNDSLISFDVPSPIFSIESEFTPPPNESSISIDIPPPQFSVSVSLTNDRVANVDFDVSPPEFSVISSFTPPSYESAINLDIPSPQFSINASFEAAGNESSVLFEIAPPVFSINAEFSPQGNQSVISFTIPAPVWIGEIGDIVVDDKAVVKYPIDSSIMPYVVKTSAVEYNIPTNIVKLR